MEENTTGDAEAGFSEGDVDRESKAHSSDPAHTPEASSGGGWGEVTAVLAAGVLPNFAWGVVSAVDQDPSRPSPYWADTLVLTTQSVCTAFVVLYLIHRSGEPWERFGLARPRLSDLLLVGPVLFLLGWFVWDLRWMLIPQLDPHSSPNWFPKPKRPADYFMMVVKYAANAFSEELVTRAYLVTRLEGLLKSQTAAIFIAAGSFASYHIYQKSDGLINMMLLGLAWGGAYLLVRRLWPFVVGHFLTSILIELR